MQRGFFFPSFLIAAKAVGAKGFKAVWTEIRGLPGGDGPCQGFVCKKTGYCISETLKCNNVNNCGKDEEKRKDKSDEADCKAHLRNTTRNNIIQI